jgi:hypothetical protein
MYPAEASVPETDTDAGSRHRDRATDVIDSAVRWRSLDGEVVSMRSAMASSSLSLWSSNRRKTRLYALHTHFGRIIPVVSSNS